MTNPQGTIHETAIVNRALAEGWRADRYPKRGQANEPDLWLGSSKFEGAIPLVFWKRLVGKKADGPRKPDGERRVVIMAEEDFWRLVKYDIQHHFSVQSKWTVNLNVTKTLGGLRKWLNEARLDQYDC